MICHCKMLLHLKRDKIYFHLFGCPESDEYKEYQKLKWYKKLFKQNPYNQYKNHLKL